MDLSTILQNQIGAQAQKELSPYSAIIPGGSKSVGVGYSASVSASSSASSGPSKSGDISGGTAFNIGGINFGTVDAPATAGGAQTPTNSIAGGAIASLSGLTVPLLLLGGALLLYVVLKRK